MPPTVLKKPALVKLGLLGGVTWSLSHTSSILTHAMLLPLTGLQRSGTLAGAETSECLSDYEGQVCASTGPRPRGRGNRLQHTSRNFAPPLQRGRALAGAETQNNEG